MSLNELNEMSAVPEGFLPEPAAEEPFSVPISPEFREELEREAAAAAASAPVPVPAEPENAFAAVPAEDAEEQVIAEEQPESEATAEPSAEPEALCPAQEPLPEDAPEAAVQCGFEEQLAQLQDTVQSGNTELAEQIAQHQAAAAEEFSKVRSKLNEMDARVSSLRRLADMHQDIEKKLNDEINEYKDNFYRRIVNPILVEFFEIQEDMHADALGADEAAAKQIMEYVDAITRTLRHYGVTVETVSVGDAYDPVMHKPVRAVPTDDPSLDKTIAKTRQTLVHFIDGKIVERAQVQVYQYVQPAAAEAAE